MLHGHLRSSDARWWVDDVMQTQGALERNRGLLGREALQPNQGLWITHCNSVHTIGMKYALDLVYLNKSLKVVKVVKGVTPLRMSGSLKASSTLELRAGEVSRLGIKVGDQLQWWEHE